VSQGFVTITPEYTIENCPKPDILVVPGGATGFLTRDEKFMAWARKVAPEAEIAFSVCTGAFVYAEIGLLDGHEATTHWGSIAALRREAPKARVVENRRFVDNGRVVTTAGVSAGIDGALHVVARLLGRAAADRTARYMEYLWQPDPEISKGYSYLNPLLDERGRKLQEGDLHRQAGRFAEAAAVYAALAAADPSDGESLYLQGLMLHLGGDLDAAIPVHEKAAALPARRTRALYNLACAWARKGEKEKALDALARAVDAGFADRAWIEADEDLASIAADSRFKEILAKIPAR
jgi:putative intracellular protease/amidase